MDESKRTRTWIIRIAIGVVVLIALVYGAIFFYVNVINDSPDALDEGDLSAAVADTSVPDSTTVPDSTIAPALDDFDGTWTPTEASEFGYRIDEVIAGVNTTAVGRGNEIDGTLAIAGSTAEVEIVVQIANITSDDSRRDRQFRGRIMEADQFPEATFVSTEPIEFSAVPLADEQVTATATGDLTLKGVTRPVTFEITAEANGDRIGVLGNIPVLFSDYGIDNPSFGAVTTEDNGLLEFVLVFEPA
jgi:polyisoprenoid-binding protein YceI